MARDEIITARYAIGIGAKRGADPQALADFVCAVASEHDVALRDAMLAAPDGREDARAFREASERLSLRVVFFSLDALHAREADVLTHSPRVQALFGVGSLCEALALTAAGEGSMLLAPRITNGGMACAIARAKGRRLHPPLEGEGRNAERVSGWGANLRDASSPPPASLRDATSPLKGEVRRRRSAVDEDQSI